MKNPKEMNSYEIYDYFYDEYFKSLDHKDMNMRKCRAWKER